MNTNKQNTASEYWGTAKQPFFYKGRNPTSDLIVFYKVLGEVYVLLDQRPADDLRGASQWCIPGGFIDSNAPKGGPWQAEGNTPLTPEVFVELAKAAGYRELSEETTHSTTQPLTLSAIYEEPLRPDGTPKEAWTYRHVFYVVEEGPTLPPVRANGEAQDAKWVKLSEALGMKLFSDHNGLLHDAALHAGFIQGEPSAVRRATM